MASVKARSRSSSVSSSIAYPPFIERVLRTFMFSSNLFSFSRSFSSPSIKSLVSAFLLFALQNLQELRFFTHIFHCRFRFQNFPNSNVQKSHLLLPQINLFPFLSPQLQTYQLAFSVNSTSFSGFLLEFWNRHRNQCALFLRKLVGQNVVYSP